MNDQKPKIVQADHEFLIDHVEYEVHFTVIFPGSQVLYFAENSGAQKLNKANNKQANITGL